MAINMSKENDTEMANTENSDGMDLQVIESFDLSSQRTITEQQLLNSPEIEAITNTIVIDDINTIVTFGGEVAENISRASDVVLNNMSMSKIDESSEMLKILGKIMDKFDIDEIREGKDSLFQKIFNNARKQLDQILSKYQTIGGEVDKVYVELKKYESEIAQSNKNLDMIFKSNVEMYQELVKYIVGGEKGVTEIEEYIGQRNEEMMKTGDNSIQFEITNLENAKIVLEQRVQDLRIAENVAMQSIPMIKTMQVSNIHLVRKINSAFIITLPIFKQALAQAIMLKRQKLQADSLSALDDKTNEMLLKNAQNTATQSAQIARLANNSSIKIETLEQSWQTIVSGIEETQRIQEEARVKRQEDTKRLNAIKADFEQKYQKGNK